jgi:hypothetical protein
MIEDLKAQYEELLHAAQSGVAMLMNYEEGDGETSPKHLRVGVNSALVQNSALAMLLMRKGVFTEEEYWAAQVELWQAEVESYEQIIEQRLGTKVTLH